MDIAKEAFELGTRINESNARILAEAERAHRVVYLLWSEKDVLLDVLKTRARADEEAERLGVSLGQVIRIEVREVRS